MSVILAYFIVGQVTYIEELIYLFICTYIYSAQFGEWLPHRSLSAHQGPSMSSSVGSQPWETSLKIFRTPVNKGYEVSGGYFPFSSIHWGGDEVHDGASAPREPNAAPPTTTSPADEAPEVGAQPAAPAVMPTCCPSPTKPLWVFTPIQ